MEPAKPLGAAGSIAVAAPSIMVGPLINYVLKAKGLPALDDSAAAAASMACLITFHGISSTAGPIIRATVARLVSWIAPAQDSGPPAPHT